MHHQLVDTMYGWIHKDLVSMGEAVQGIRFYFILKKHAFGRQGDYLWEIALLVRLLMSNKILVHYN